MNFIKILELLWIFKVIVKKIISIIKYTQNLQIIYMYIIIYIYIIYKIIMNNIIVDSWKSPTTLKFKIFLSHIIDAKVLIAMNHSKV
jgi:hypothetical protein